MERRSAWDIDLICYQCISIGVTDAGGLGGGRGTGNEERGEGERGP
jgi:hypothetical protein